ncbi:MAG: hypothetical protein ACI8RZ_001668, partial [Myxococcota bacterium]
PIWDALWLPDKPRHHGFGPGARARNTAYSAYPRR